MGGGGGGGGGVGKSFPNAKYLMRPAHGCFPYHRHGVLCCFFFFTLCQEYQFITLSLALFFVFFVFVFVFHSPVVKVGLEMKSRKVLGQFSQYIVPTVRVPCEISLVSAKPKCVLLRIRMLFSSIKDPLV